MCSVFITGTDTDIGKTVVTAGLAASLKQRDYPLGVMKPVQSGAIEKDDQLLAPDIEFIKQVVKAEKEEQIINPILLKAPVAPDLAADLENKEVDLEKIDRSYKRLKENYQNVIVEGAGGMIVPIKDDYLISDLIKRLNLSIIIVARPNLGTINHTCLTVEYAQSRDIDIAGIIINALKEEKAGIIEKTNPETIESLTGVKVLGVLPWINDLEKNPAELLSTFEANINVDYIIDYLKL